MKESKTPLKDKLDRKIYDTSHLLYRNLNTIIMHPLTWIDLLQELGEEYHKIGGGKNTLQYKSYVVYRSRDVKEGEFRVR